MQKFPHRYAVTAVGEPTESITLSSPDLPDLTADSPPEWDGPPGLWSPETLLLASAANCLALTWRAVATHNNFEWTDVRVEVTGVLDRIDRVTRFTELHVTAHLTLPAGADREKADKLMQKAESACLITNSLNSTISLEVDLIEG